MNKIDVFIVGAGNIAYEHAKGVYAAKANLAGIIEVDEKRATEFLKAYPDIKCFKNIAEFMEYKPRGVELVIVAVPPPFHYEICSKLIDRNSHILCEKPLAVTAEEAYKLEELSKKSNVLMGCCESRFCGFEPIKLAAEYIANNKLGKVYLIEQKAINRQFRNGIEYQPETKWFINKKLSGGGPVMDWGVYDLAVIQTIMGGIVKCDVKYSKLANHLAPIDKQLEETYDVEEHGYVVSDLTDKNNNTFTYIEDRASVNNGPEFWYLRILGDKGGLDIKWLTWNAEFVYYSNFGKNGQVTENIQIDPNYNPHAFPVINMIEAIQTGGSPLINFENGALHIDYIQQAYKKSGFYSKP